MKSAPVTNLVQMKGTRRRPEEGDTFYLQLPTQKYIFGMVRFAETKIAPMPGAYLIYIYDWQSSVPVPDYSQLLSERLLIAPVWTNRMAWTKGYFRHIENSALRLNGIPRHHCFRRATGLFVNEKREPLSARTELCGEWGLVSYRWIDDRVSEALGIEPAPSN